MTSNNNSNNNSTNNSYRLSPEQQLRYHVEQKQLEIFRQSSVRSTKSQNKNDLESKINRFYSKLLVKYHWLFLLAGIIISFVLTGVSFVKQPLPNFLDPKRGFGARGEGTLTSQLIVMKNVNAELTKYHKSILELYDKIKKENRTSDYSDFDSSFNNDEYTGTNDTKIDTNTDPPDDLNNSVEDDTDTQPEGNIDEENEPDDPGTQASSNNDDDFADYESKTASLVKKGKRDLSLSSSDSSSESFPLPDLLKTVIWKKLTGSDLLKMVPDNLTISQDSKIFANHALNRINFCNYSLGLDANLEFYFSSSKTSPIVQDLDSADSETLDSTFKRNLTEKMSSIKTSEYFVDIDDEYSSLNDPDAPSDSIDAESKVNYFKEKEENLLNVRKLKSLCKWDQEIIKILTQPHKNQEICYFSLPFLVAILNNKTNCMEINSNDVRNFLNIIIKCYDLHASGILFAAAEELKEQPEIIKLINKNNPKSQFLKLPIIKENICFKHNLLYIFYDYLVDKDFLSNKKQVNINNYNNNQTMPLNVTKSTNNNNENINKINKFKSKLFNVKISSLLIINNFKVVNKTELVDGEMKINSILTNQKLFNENFIYDFYIQYFHKNQYDDHETQLISLNLMGIRQEAAMRFISQEMLLVALAIVLIVIVTLLYLKSIFISMIVNLGVGMSVGVSFFAYRIVFDIDLFPFINMMSAFLLIGIACDDVYVLFDAWYNEKAKIIMEDLPDMIEKQYEKSNENVNHSNNNENESSNDSHTVVSVKPSDEYILPPIFVMRKFLNTNLKDKAKEKEKEKTNSKIYKKDENNMTSAENDSFLKEQDVNNTISTKQANRQSVLGNSSALDTELLQKGIDINQYELNPSYVRVAPLTDEQMVRVMGGTLRHAASSIFVTSFTTAAAFLTNFITKLPYVQLFGVFTGTCILVYFSMVITMVAAFVISYEKYIQPFRCKVRTNLTNKLEELFQNLMDFLALLNHRLVTERLPKIIIKFRIMWFCLFFILGVAGMLAVFYKPQLKPPSNWRYQFFKNGNLFENFEFDTKDRFWSYINEEKRNLTNPEIFFVFGIQDKDTGRVFNPDDDGHLLYDKSFDFLDEKSQLWLNEFINKSIASRRDLFLVDDIVREWRTYLFQMQMICSNTLEIDETKMNNEIFLPYPRKKLSKCRDEVNDLLINSTVENFENLMSSFPRRIIFMANGSDVKGLLLRINANRTFIDYETVRDYYLELKQFHEEKIAQAPDGFKGAWFISVAFALYDIQYQLITGTYSSLVASMAIALIILLLTSGNIVISLFAIITISFSIADTIAVFVFMGWDLNILESIVIIMSVGLSVDFSCHYGVAYINCDVDSSHHIQNKNSFCSGGNENQEENDSMAVISKIKQNNTQSNSKQKCKFIRNFIRRYRQNNKERYIRINEIFGRVGSAVLMAAFTTFLAGMSMLPSSLTSFSKMGQFLVLVMCFSYIYATFFFVPMCALFGPTKNFGNLMFKDWSLKIFRKYFSNKSKKSSNNNNSNLHNNAIAINSSNKAITVNFNTNTSKV